MNREKLENIRDILEGKDHLGIRTPGSGLTLVLATQMVELIDAILEPDDAPDHQERSGDE